MDFPSFYLTFCPFFDIGPLYFCSALCGGVESLGWNLEADGHTKQHLGGVINKFIKTIGIVCRSNRNFYLCPQIA